MSYILDALRRGTVPAQGLDALAVGIEAMAAAFDEEGYYRIGDAGFVVDEQRPAAEQPGVQRARLVAGVVPAEQQPAAVAEAPRRVAAQQVRAALRTRGWQRRRQRRRPGRPQPWKRRTRQTSLRTP